MRYATALLTAALVAVAVVGCGQPADTPVAPPQTSPSPTSASATATAPQTPSHTSSGSSAASPPFVAQARWVSASGGRSLRVYPTSAGRVAQGPTDADEAWSEVLRLAPDADQPGMRAQFDCHWTYARLVAPDKPSWNLEPWRPVVSPQQMVDARCNPGGPESLES